MTAHKLDPAPETTADVFSPEHTPVLDIEPGDTVVVRSLDALGYLARQTAPGQEQPKMFPAGRGHCLTGPIRVRGAEPGDTLALRLIDLRPDPWGWTTAAHLDTPVTRRLGIEKGPPGWLLWDLDPDAGRGTCNLGLSRQLGPFLGVMGLSPAEPGEHSTIPPRAACGGNIDCKELVAGSTLYLPIPVDGALFSAGDGHALQGDGEVAGPALECPMEAAELEFHLRPDLAFARARAHTPRGWITFGFHDSLDEATAFALADMLDLLDERLGCGRREALALASLVVDLHVTQIVNGVRGVHAMVTDEALAGLVKR